MKGKNDPGGIVGNCSRNFGFWHRVSMYKDKGLHEDRTCTQRLIDDTRETFVRVGNLINSIKRAKCGKTDIFIRSEWTSDNEGRNIGKRSEIFP